MKQYTDQKRAKNVQLAVGDPYLKKFETLFEERPFKVI